MDAAACFLIRSSAKVLTANRKRSDYELASADIRRVPTKMDVWDLHFKAGSSPVTPAFLATCKIASFVGTHGEMDAC